MENEPPCTHHPTSPVSGVITLWSRCFIPTYTHFPFLYFEQNPRDYIISSVFQYESLKDKDTLKQHNCT